MIIYTYIMRIVETESYKLISAGWFDKIFPTKQDSKPDVQQELGVKIQDVKKRIQRLQTLKNIAKNNKDIKEMQRLDGLINDLFMSQQQLLEQQYGNGNAVPSF